MTVQVLVADDQELVRAGFAAVLGTQPDFEVVAEAATGREAVDLVRAHRPDVVLMDVRMPDLETKGSCSMRSGQPARAESGGAGRVGSPANPYAHSDGRAPMPRC